MPPKEEMIEIPMSLFNEMIGGGNKQKITPTSDSSSIEFVTDEGFARKRQKLSHENDLSKLTVESVLAQTTAAPKDDILSINDDSSDVFPKKRLHLDFEGQDDPISLPEYSQGECPIRNLMISNKMLADFHQFRLHMVDKFTELNPDFQKKAYDRCINCWMDTLYKVERH